MSRKKGLQKFDYTEADTITAVARAKHGDDWGLVHWIGNMRFIFKNLKASEAANLPPRPIDQLALEAEGGRLIQALREAIEKKDGTLFHKIADAVEDQQEFLGNEGNKDARRAKLLLYSKDWSGKQKRKFTVRELATALNLPTDDNSLRVLRRECEELNIDLKRGPIGAPRKKADNSSKRKS